VKTERQEQCNNIDCDICNDGNMCEICSYPQCSTRSTHRYCSSGTALFIIFSLCDWFFLYFTIFL